MCDWPRGARKFVDTSEDDATFDVGHGPDRSACP